MKPGRFDYRFNYLGTDGKIPQEFLREHADIISPAVLDLEINTSTVGEKVSFTKKDYADPVEVADIIIPGELEITRNNNGLIYNRVYEGSQSYDSPVNTEWNSDGWVNLEGGESRVYNVFGLILSGYPAYNTLLRNFIMRHIPTGRMWLIKFNSWTAGNQGGGFSWDRYEIFVPVTYTRPDNVGPDVRDIIHPGKLEIARRDDAYGIFNYPYEYDITVFGNGGIGIYQHDYAMMFTQWNSQWTDSASNGFSDLSNIRTRTYNSFVNALNGDPDSNIVNEELVMHDLIENNYYKVVFSDWTGAGAGGGFSYTRTLIPLSSAVSFSDGSSMKTAPLSPPTYRANARTFTNLLPIQVEVNLNTAGTVNWTYVTDGVYNVSFPAGFLTQYTYINITQQISTPPVGGPGTFTVKSINYFTNQITIEHYNSSGTLANPGATASLYIEVIK